MNNNLDTRIIEYFMATPSALMGLFVLLCIGYSISWALFSYKNRTPPKLNFWLNSFVGSFIMAVVVAMINRDLFFSDQEITFEMINRHYVETLVFAIFVGFLLFTLICIIKELKFLKGSKKT